MNFNSWQFLVFLPIVLLLYWVIPAKWRWILLLVASYYFYMSWNAWLVFPIMVTTLVSYGCAILVSKTEKQGYRKLYLILTLVICLGTLIFFKYFNFLIQSVVDFLNLFSLKLTSPVFDILLPVGISFYTFQTLSYVIDVYRKKFEPEYHLGYYALYVVYFPQLVAGPIERPGDLLPQLKQPHNFGLDEFVKGFAVLLYGFFMKCVVADFFGVYVNNIFAQLASANGLSIFIGGFFFFIQMYCDFAGYSNIAIGCARMMGVKLTKNFDQPYVSVSYGEFFRRWHISLSRWFRDYLYIPLGGSRKGKWRKILNTYIVFGLCGLWHGANWTYLFWGLYCATFISLESLILPPIKKFFLAKNIDIDKNPPIRVVRMLLMEFIYVPASILFRAGSVSDGFTAIGRMFTTLGFSGEYFSSTVSTLGIDLTGFLYLFFAFVALILLYYFIESYCYRIREEEQQEGKLLSYESSRTLVVIVLLVTVIALSWLTLIANSDSSTFSYFQF